MLFSLTTTIFRRKIHLFHFPLCHILFSIFKSCTLACSSSEIFLTSVYKDPTGRIPVSWHPVHSLFRQFPRSQSKVEVALKVRLGRLRRRAVKLDTSILHRNCYRYRYFLKINNRYSFWINLKNEPILNFSISSLLAT